MLETQLSESKVFVGVVDMTVIVIVIVNADELPVRTRVPVRTVCCTDASMHGVAGHHACNT